MAGHWIPIHMRQIYQGFLRGPKELNNKRLAELVMDGQAQVIDKNVNATGIEDSKIPDDPEVDRLKSYINDEIWNMIDPRMHTREVWGHIMRGPYDHTAIHSHYNKKDYARICLSWAYYPQLPKAKGGRYVIHFQSHSESVNFQVQPEVGMFMIFPSWMPHYTTRHSSDEVRITIAANCRPEGWPGNEKDYQAILDDEHSGIKEFNPPLRHLQP